MAELYGDPRQDEAAPTAGLHASTAPLRNSPADMLP
jgi:hypothetical protein